MSWITPLGFLGLISLVVLIIIYIIKPNYQKKVISSTYVWKLSLQKKKRNIPISKLRNLLIFLCQILILTGASLILAQPFLQSNDPSLSMEKIVVIDASASMWTESSNGETRFERAVAQVKNLATEITEDGGLITVILADREAEILGSSRIDKESVATLNRALDLLVRSGEEQCSFGAADIDGAMGLAQAVLEENPNAEVQLFTGKRYLEKGNVKVVDVSGKDEWNGAVLSAEAIVEENYYTVEVEVAAYNSNVNLVVCCDIYGANYESEYVPMRKHVTLEDDQSQKLIFKTSEEGTPVYLYDYIHVYLETEQLDSFAYDNDIFIYGGGAEKVGVQYYSSQANTFIASSLIGMRDIFQSRWDFELNEIQEDEYDIENNMHYDLYIFEHTMPSELPTDGVVFLINPDVIPTELSKDVSMMDTPLAGNYTLSKNGKEHALTNYITAGNIEISQYRRISEYDGYEPLLFVEGTEDPVLLLKDTPEQKIVIMPVSLNFSDLAIKIEFPILMYNIINYFFPPMLTEHVYDVNDLVTVNGRSEVVDLIGPNTSESYYELPGVYDAVTPGTYTISQLPMNGVEIIDNFYVKVPSAESNIVQQFDILENPYVNKDSNFGKIDLLVYFAAALVLLLFVEWWLQSRDAL